MVDGFIPTPDFNEQLKKAVREMNDGYAVK